MSFIVDQNQAKTTPTNSPKNGVQQIKFLGIIIEDGIENPVACAIVYSPQVGVVNIPTDLKSDQLKLGHHLWFTYEKRLQGKFASSYFATSVEYIGPLVYSKTELHGNKVILKVVAYAVVCNVAENAVFLWNDLLGRIYVSNSPLVSTLKAFNLVKIIAKFDDFYKASDTPWRADIIENIVDAAKSHNIIIQITQLFQTNDDFKVEWVKPNEDQRFIAKLMHIPTGKMVFMKLMDLNKTMEQPKKGELYRVSMIYEPKEWKSPYRAVLATKLMPEFQRGCKKSEQRVLELHPIYDTPGVITDDIIAAHKNFYNSNKNIENESPVTLLSSSQNVHQIETALNLTTLENGNNLEASKISETINNKDSKLIDTSTMETLSTEDFVPIGKIGYDPDDCLGEGLGSFVYNGFYEKETRQAAIKKIQKRMINKLNFGLNEIDILRKCKHDNILHYFGHEYDKEYYYIANELCACTLEEFVNGNSNSENELIRKKVPMLQNLRQRWTNKKEILKQITLGVEYLHIRNYIHGDIKPANILFTVPDDAGHSRVVISDFGLTKSLNYGQYSVTFNDQSGTRGYMAFEIIDYAMNNPKENLNEIINPFEGVKNKKKSIRKAVDIFSLGIVFYYVLTNGKNPFGSQMREIEDNIVNDRPNYGALQSSKELDADTIHLAREFIKWMISRDFNLRPSARAVLNHPLFWENEKKLDLLIDISNLIHPQKDHYKDELNALNNVSLDIIPQNWADLVDQRLFKVNKSRHANNTKPKDQVFDVIVHIRNAVQHFNQGGETARKDLEDIMQSKGSKDFKNCIYTYYSSFFPKLFTHAYVSINPRATHQKENMLIGYYSEDTREFFKKINPHVFPKNSLIHQCNNGERQPVIETIQQEQMSTTSKNNTSN